MDELYTEEQLTKWKLEFAENILLKPNDGLMIVKRLLPKDANPFTVINFNEVWPSDPIVKAEMTRILAIPMDKNKITLEVLQIARNKMAENRDRIAAYKVAADMQGWNSSTTAAKGKVQQGDRLAELAAMVNGE